MAIISATISAHFIRDERWDIVLNLLQQLDDTLKTRTGVGLSHEAIVKGLTQAGASKLEVQLIAGKPPRYKLRGLAKIGYPYVKFTVNDDGSLTVEPSKTNV